MAAKKLKVLINLVIIVAITFLIFSCNTTKTSNNNVITTENDTLLDLPGVNDVDSGAISFGDLLFCKTQNSGQIGAAKLFNFIREYIGRKMYNDMTFEKYISDIYLLNTKMECDNSLVFCFELNDSVCNLYKKNTFAEYLRQTTNTSKFEKDLYLVKTNSDVSDTVLYTVMYYLYINNYYCAFDDLSGYWYCEKIDDFYGQIKSIDLQRYIDMEPYDNN